MRIDRDLAIRLLVVAVIAAFLFSPPGQALLTWRAKRKCEAIPACVEAIRGER